MICNPDDPIEVAVKTNLTEGQIVDSLPELCRLCKIYLGQGGKQRKNAETKLARYINFTKFTPEGKARQKILINEIFEEPHVPSRRQHGKYRDRLVRSMLFDLTHFDSPEETVVFDTSYVELAEQMGFINQHFQALASNQYELDADTFGADKSLSDISRKHIDEFLIVCRNRFKTPLEGMLAEMLSKGFLDSIVEYKQLVLSDHSRRVADDLENEIIVRLFHEYLSDGKTFYLMSTAERKKLLIGLFKEINKECEDYHYELCERGDRSDSYVPILYILPRFSIKFNKTKLINTAIRNGIDMIEAERRCSEKNEIAALFKEALKNDFRNREKRTIKAEKKKIADLNSTLAVGDVSNHKPLEHIYLNYSPDMDALINITIGDYNSI